MSLENTKKGLSRAHVDDIFKENFELPGELVFLFTI